MKMKIKIIVIFSEIIFSCLYLLYSHYENKQYLKSSLQNFNKKKNEKDEKARRLMFKNNVKKNSIKDLKEPEKGKENTSCAWDCGIQYKESLKRYRSSTDSQKACVKTLGNGIYSFQTLSWKLDNCHVH